MSGNLPPDDELVHGSGSMANGSEADSVYVLKRVAIVAGTDFRSADPGTDSNTGQRTVHFTLTNEAGDKFWDYTSANVGHSMAVVLGGRVKEVANIESAIRDSGEIRGSFSQDEVAILSKMLRTGALPASINYLEDRTVGASLGADSIKQGVTAAVVGVLLVMIFMLVYYKGSGSKCGLGTVPEPCHPARVHGLLWSDADVAGHCRSHPDDRYGRRLQRADLRAHSRRDASRKSAFSRSGPRICARVDDDRGHARDDNRFGGDSVPVRKWAGEGIRSDADLWSGGKPVYGRLCVAGDLRCAREQSEVRRGRFDLAGTGRAEGLFSIALPEPCEVRIEEGREPVEFFHSVNVDWLGKKWYFLAFSLIFSVSGIHLDGGALGASRWVGVAVLCHLGWTSGAVPKSRCNSSRRRISSRFGRRLRTAGIRDASIVNYDIPSHNEVLISLPEQHAESASGYGKAAD